MLNRKMHVQVLNNIAKKNNDMFQASSSIVYKISEGVNAPMGMSYVDYKFRTYEVDNKEITIVEGKPPVYKISDMSTGGKILTESSIFPSYTCFSVNFQVGSQDQNKEEEGMINLVKEFVKVELG